jgi:hypothetical protein
MKRRCYGNKRTERTGASSRERIYTEREIDRDLENSFPASDPPGWVLGLQRTDAKRDDDSEVHQRDLWG